jgi:hypothetical protein
MLRSLFKSAPAAQGWTDAARARVEAASARIFKRIGTQCTARAFEVPDANGSLLLVELRSDVQWSSDSLATAKTILMQGLNSELGFKLTEADLILAFAKTRPAVTTPIPKPKPVAKRPPVTEAPESRIEVTEIGDSQWSAFGPTQAPGQDVAAKRQGR